MGTELRFCHTLSELQLVWASWREVPVAGRALGEVDILTDGAVKKAGFLDYLRRLRDAWMMEGIS